MLIAMPTDKTVSDAATSRQAAVEANHFGVMHVIVKIMKESAEG